MKRASGILLPLFSLPGKRGGDMGSEAYRFIDMLKRAGQRYWQLLPLGPVNDKGCPYQSTSAFAGEAAYISVEKLVEIGRLDSRDVELPRRSAIAMAREKDGGSEEFMSFCHDERSWLDDFALYSVLSERFGKDWSIWEEDISHADAKAMNMWSEELSEEIDMIKWGQFLFFEQWGELLSYAHEKGVSIIGDVPYSVSYESADCWTHRELFEIDEEGRQLMSIGAPPDYFTPEGQCWDNPIYNWQAHRNQEYEWWINRLKQQFRFFDVVRMDHMRGFESYYSIPSDTKDPRDGRWEKGPGLDFFARINETLDREKFIAEDLGTLTEEVYRLIDGTGYPGMKVLQFAFDTGEENIYLPLNYRDDNCVVYTGTHDNDTTRGWYEKAEDWKKRFLTWYLREKSGTSFASVDRGDELSPEDAVKGMIELAHSSGAMLSIIPMQDYLGLGTDARINMPGVADGNWCWQTEEGAFSEELADSIAHMCREYDR